MADASNERRRRVIRQKLADGSLPRSFPRTMFSLGDVKVTMMVGKGSGQPCSACGEAIGTQEVRITYLYSSERSLGVHKECDDMWRQELNRPLERKKKTDKDECPDCHSKRVSTVGGGAQDIHSPTEWLYQCEEPDCRKVYVKVQKA